MQHLVQQPLCSLAVGARFGGVVKVIHWEHFVHEAHGLPMHALSARPNTYIGAHGDQKRISRRDLSFSPVSPWVNNHHNRKMCVRCLREHFTAPYFDTCQSG